MDVPAAQTVALVGGTGSGKSTLLKLLLRFHDPARGRILLDGEDIAAIDPVALRQRIGYVAQDPFLTDGSVADNIAYGERQPDRARIEAAARAAEAHDFIAALPNGYDSAVGERGANLSGGQRPHHVGCTLVRHMSHLHASMLAECRGQHVTDAPIAGVSRKYAFRPTAAITDQIRY